MRVIPPVVAAVLGLFQLAEPSLWIDEAFTARAMSRGYGHLTGELHWLYYTAMKPWATLAGTTEFALRLPSVLGAVLAVSLLYGLAKKMFDERVAFVAALLLAINPFFVLWSQQARSYTFLVCFAIGSTWLLLRALERDDWLAWGWYALAFVCIVLVQFFSAFLLLPVHVLTAWRSQRARISWVVILAASLPWLAHTLRRGEAGAPVDWLRRPGLEELGEYATHVPGAFGIGLLVALVGLAMVGKPFGPMLGAWAVLPVALSLIGSAWKPMFLDRYLIVSAPAFAVLAAIALVGLVGRARVVAIGAIGAGTLVGLALVYAPSGGDNWKGENWRAATKLVEGQAKVVPDWALPGFEYYGGRAGDSGWILERAEYPDQFVEATDVRATFGARLRARLAR